MRTVTTRLAALVCACLALTACEDIFTPPYTYGEVEVVVATAAGVPGPDIDFVLYTGTRHLGFETTGADGTARFRFVPEGSLGLYGTGTGAYGLPEPLREFRMSEGERRTVTFTAVGPGAIRVRVEDAAGAPVLGLWVEVYDWTRMVAEMFVERPQPLLFSDLGVGDYGVRVLESEACRLPPDGFVYSDGFVVEEGAVVDVTLVIDCSEAPPG